MKRISILTLMLFVFIGTAFGQLANADRSLIHTQPGTVIDKGDLRIYNNLNFYSKAGDVLGGLKPENFKTTNYWLVSDNLVFGYGISEHFDATLGIRLYQDTHYDNEFNLPDDLFLTIRAGSFKFSRNHFHHGFMTSFRIPTAEVHNYPFTEYASGAFEYGLMWALSFYKDAYLPKRNFNLHFNIGWWNHNEKGTVLYEFQDEDDPVKDGVQLKATKNSSELRMALATVFPSNMFDFRLELSGMLYLNKTDPFVYSAEEWAFFTPSMRFKPADWANLDLGIDFRLSEKRQWTKGIPDLSKELKLPPSYPGWRLHLGAEINFNLLGGKQQTLNYDQAEAQKKVEMFETILKERDRAKTAEKEIESLRNVRKETDKEIEELKKILED